MTRPGLKRYRSSLDRGMRFSVFLRVAKLQYYTVWKYTELTVLFLLILGHEMHLYFYAGDSL